MVMAGIAAVTAFLGAFFIVFSLLSRRESAVEARVRSLAGPDLSEGAVDHSLPFGERVVDPWLSGWERSWPTYCPPPLWRA